MLILGVGFKLVKWLGGNLAYDAKAAMQCATIKNDKQAFS
jgi:hypothetical protein